MSIEKGEINSGIRMVDTAGFVSRQRRIKALINAGKRLEELRHQGYFDVLPGEEVPDDLRPDPTRSPGYDLSDASTSMREIAERASKRNTERIAKEKEKEKLKEDTGSSEKTPPKASGEE